MSLGKSGAGDVRHRGWGRCPHAEAQGCPWCKAASTATCSPFLSSQDCHCFLPQISASRPPKKNLPFPSCFLAPLPSLLYSFPPALLSLLRPGASPRDRAHRPFDTCDRTALSLQHYSKQVCSFSSLSQADLNSPSWKGGGVQ